MRINQVFDPHSALRILERSGFDEAYVAGAWALL
jgi:hypothetical protein